MWLAKEKLMTVFGKRLSEYVAFCKPILGLILVVGIVRLAISLGGAPTSTAKWFSIMAVIWIGVLYHSIRVHTSGFGSYKQLLPIFVLQSITAQAIIVSGIVIAILTGKDNIFSVPESFFGRDGKTWSHAGAHLIVGTTIWPLIFWLIGCLIMFVTKRLITRGAETKAAARA
jgi:hypothetical protein